jgi:hypothetical protein
MLELDGERRDSRFILVWALDHDWVIALCLVGVSLLRWIDYVVLSLVIGVPMPSLYIDRESCGAVTILVGSKEGVLNYIQKLLSIWILLVWHILLGLGVMDATPLLALVCGPGQGPRLVVTSLGNPMGPTSTSPRAFHGWTQRLPYFSRYAWWIKLVPSPFDVKPWSGPVLKKSFKWRALSVAPEPLAIWNKKLEGLEFRLLKNWNTLLRICTLQPSSIFPSSFWSSRTRIEGLLLSS